mgnify:CR=1 FL=1
MSAIKRYAAHLCLCGQNATTTIGTDSVCARCKRLSNERAMVTRCRPPFIREQLWADAAPTETYRCHAPTP